MGKLLKYIFINLLVLIMMSCVTKQDQSASLTAADILGNINYQAISYSGYRGLTRDIQPTVADIKEDMLILAAMDIKLIRTYDVIYEHSGNVLKAIDELKKEIPGFEMHVMLGAWIDCKNAWTDLPPDHNIESENNAGEIERAIDLAKQYPDIVKIIAVGNEAMVHWAQNYYVQPGVILKWVNYLQEKKKEGELPKDLWITSSDNFASWGGGDSVYHTEDLNALIKAVDFISMHTYAMHDTHYNPDFWGNTKKERDLPELEKIRLAMRRAADYSISQYESVVKYMRSLGVDKPVHIGETGWSTMSKDLYGKNGSKATDEYKSALYYQFIREWSNQNNVSCFFFEAFDEPWKDDQHPDGSENHFGLINIESQAKYVLWELVDKGIFDNLVRNGKKITKTYEGDLDSLLTDIDLPPSAEVVAPMINTETK